MNLCVCVCECTSCMLFEETDRLCFPARPAMGKRASAPKAKPPAKRSKTSVAPPPAPAVWARPIPPVLTERDPLAVFLLDIEDGPSSTGGNHELRLYGITKQGHSVCARIHNFHPYFYARCGPEVVGRENEIQAALQAAMPPSPAGSHKAIVCSALA